MNPDKLFDYLDGKLSPADREELEEQLMSDAQLRREFNIAREIHRTGGVSREVIMPDEDPAIAERGARLGRRIATAAILLVFLNVFFGLYFIANRTKKTSASNRKEAQIREQLNASLGAAAQQAMPTPTLGGEDIRLTAARSEWDNIANRVIAAAELFGGTGRKALPDESQMAIVVEIPTAQENEFRQAIKTAAAISPMPAITAGAITPVILPNEKTIFQVRVTTAAP